MNDKKLIQAKDVMRQNYIEMDGMKTVKDAIEQMKAENVTLVIVKKRNEHDAYGLLLLSDIAKKVLAKDRSPERVNIYEIMSKPVMSVAPGLDIRYCARMFERFGLSVAPVIEGEQVMGMISYEELVLHEL